MPEEGPAPEPNSQAQPAGMARGRPKRVLRRRHWGLIILSALVILAELAYGYRAWDMGGNWWWGRTDLVPREVAMPMEDDASDESILAAFSELCDTELEATPQYDDRFKAVYECSVAGNYVWLSIDRGPGDAIRYVTLAPCFAGLDPTNTIFAGRWMVDMIGDPIPASIDARLPAAATRWYCPPEDPDAPA